MHCVSAGTTTITATAADGSRKSASLSLTVRDPLTSLTLDKTQTTLLYGGATTTVTASTTPSDYDANNLTWTIGDTSLATISGSGKTRTITSNNTKKTGETTLTVSGGGKTATMKVSVVNFTTTTYSYTGSVQQVDLPAGNYKLEVWGAQGGSGVKSGGKGGYSAGNLSVSNNTKIYICIGGKGSYSTSNSVQVAGGYNGGGSGESSSTSPYGGGGGGGATDIRIGTDSLHSRVIVAGGGGGAIGTTVDTSGVNGAAGGGVTGLSASGGGKSYVVGGGGTSTAGGSGKISGTFGLGGTGDPESGTSSSDGGGGGGWYGGGKGFRSGGGGGSGYVYTSGTASNYPSGCLLNSSYYLTDAQTIDGNQSFPNVAGTGNETGHSGNGAAKITLVN